MKHPPIIPESIHPEILSEMDNIQILGGTSEGTDDVNTLGDCKDITNEGCTNSGNCIVGCACNIDPDPGRV